MKAGTTIEKTRTKLFITLAHTHRQHKTGAGAGQDRTGQDRHRLADWQTGSRPRAAGGFLAKAQQKLMQSRQRRKGGGYNSIKQGQDQGCWHCSFKAPHNNVSDGQPKESQRKSVKK